MSYIIKKVTIKKAKVNYEEKAGYEFAPKSKNYENVTKVTVFDNDLKTSILKKKIDNDYKKIVMQIYAILNDTSDDDSANVLTAFTELDRLKHIFISKYEEKMNKKILETYLKKISILEMEMNKLLLNALNFENQSKGARR